MYPQVTAGRVLRSSIENTYPVATLNKWLLALGEFDTLNPHQAAERWGMPLKNTLERLHAMVGGPLEIVPGLIEVYREAVWRNPEAPALQPGKETWDKTRLDRLNMIPVRRCDHETACTVVGNFTRLREKGRGGYERAGLDPTHQGR